MKKSEKQRGTGNAETPCPDPSLIWTPPRFEDMDRPGPGDRVVFLEDHPPELVRRREEAAKKRMHGDDDVSHEPDDRE